MKFDFAAVRKCLKSFDFNTLFREHLGWDKHQAQLDVPVDGDTVHLAAVAQKRGFIAYVCPTIPDRAVRLKIDHQVTKSAREHFVIYTDQTAGQQIWQWVRREPGKPFASRDHRFDATTTGDALIQRLDQIAVSMEEEENIALPDVAGKARAAFDVDKVTKKFYDRFKAEHAAFLKFIKGINAQADLEWYTSLMLNRLMFVYFIQKKGFLDGDTNYLQNRMRLVREIKGRDKFLSFYRYFLLRLFHDGLGKLKEERMLDRELEKLIGKVPYLNGGFFEVHQLEERNTDIDIPDKAFEKLFAFFDDFSWHLDERPLRSGNEINPDVVGYIFEKYINQKQMGAYYTKEDITEYISKNTIIPFLFDAAQKKCPIAFKPESFLWRLLRDDPDRYIFAAVRHGVITPSGEIIPLPPAITLGLTDVSKREGWNRPASDLYGLPTETWREHVARRERSLEIREKLRRGEVHQINDLVTLNLDIWQFARDAIVNSEGPELLRAFWQAIAGRVPDKSNEKFEPGITILDPACGSGAFLFAALRILETLYSDCLERMERFVEDHDAIAGKSSKANGGKIEKFADFRDVLAQVGKHHNQRYFILKSIIISNLFGVDIMEEAVEICKLRLFLKLVAQVEPDQEIEPLPDIDFNIRAGNTLVGFVSLDDVRKSQAGSLNFSASEIKRIEEEALTVEKCFEQFRAQQTRHGGKVTPKDKQELRRRLGKLDLELDRYLAGEYGIDVEKRSKDFDAWKVSHQPFHWLVEFYGIMGSGGFDVIIGNPPYVELKNIKQYALLGYKTEECGDLYSLVMERSETLTNLAGKMGMIIPVSISSTDGFDALRKLILKTEKASWCLGFAERPSKLFTGVEKRLAIWLGSRSGSGCSLFLSNYRRWLAEERGTLFHTSRFTERVAIKELVGSSLPKIARPIERSILQKLGNDKALKSQFLKHSVHNIYYTRKVRYFVQFFDFVPEIRDSKGKLIEPSELKTIGVPNAISRDVGIAVLNSGLFFWFFSVYSDVRNLNRREIEAFPCSLDKNEPHDAAHFQKLCKRLMKDFQSNAKMSTNDYGKFGRLTIQTFQPRLSKPIIDEIDRVLAKHYGFTDDELEFIINFDIKYRMGQDGNEEEED